MLASLASFSLLSPTTLRARRSAAPISCAAEADWRDVRARLVAAEQGKAAASRFLFESPLIERGTVLLDATQDVDAATFALHQQYFHKSVMLLLEHTDAYTKGIILNRPSVHQLEGWRVWFGGDVAEGGFFRAAEPFSDAHSEPREVVCLHSLDDEAAARLSLPVIRGVSQTSLEGAQALVAQGVATRDDFQLFVGCAGWGPEQLQGEVDDGTWVMASADSATLLRELLRRGAALPPPPPPLGVVDVDDDEAAAATRGVDGRWSDDDGVATWEALMASVGRAAAVERSRGSLADRMLAAWIGARLRPPALPAALPAALLAALSSSAALSPSRTAGQLGS